MSTAHQPGGGALDLAALSVRVPDAPETPTLAEMRDARPLMRRLFEHQQELTRSVRQVADSQAAVASAVLGFDAKLETAIRRAEERAEVKATETAARVAQESVPDLVEEANRSREQIAKDRKAKRWRAFRMFVAKHAGEKLIEHMVHVGIAFAGLEALRLLHH